jgi:hypothetical protein
MNVLFIHQNHPGQFQHLAQHLADQPGNRVIFVSQPNENCQIGVETCFYTPFRTPTPNLHHYLFDLEKAVIWGQLVHEVCRGLKAQGFHPDIVIGHSGWGETLFVKDVWPEVPLLAYFEFCRVRSDDAVDARRSAAASPQERHQPSGLPVGRLGHHGDKVAGFALSPGNAPSDQRHP